MNNKFKTHLESIIKRQTIQVILMTFVFLLLTALGVILIISGGDGVFASVIPLLFAISFLVLTIIDFLFLRSNKALLKEPDASHQLIAKSLKNQYQMYASRGRGVSGQILKFFYKPLINHYKLAIEALNIEKQIKL